MKRFSVTMMAILMVLTMVLSSASAEGGWLPKTEMEFVVPSAAGGGSDTNARVISDLAFSNGFSPKNFKVNNMPGGSGAVAFAYVAGRAGSDETIMVLVNGQIMSTLTNQSPIVSSDLTYLPVVAFDNLLLCIPKDSPYQSIEELLAAAKEKPGEITVGGSQRGNTDHLSFEMMRKYMEADIAYVQFNSSGEVMSAVLGGHVNFGIFNPSECMGQLEAGEIIPIATFSGERLGGVFSEIRTFGECGFPEIIVTEVRALAGAPGMSPEAIAFYDEMIKNVTETEAWNTDYIEKNYLKAVYMTSAEAAEFFAKEIETYISIFKEVGVM